MKTAILLTLLFWSTIAPTGAQTPTEWQVVAQNTVTSVSVERHLYLKAGGKEFFVHVRISSKTTKDLSVDLRDRHRLFYPNQWSAWARPARDQVDEERISGVSLTPELTKSMIADFHAGRLMPVGKALDYYRAFSGKIPDELSLAHGHYLIVSMDGQLFFSDGSTVDSLTLAWENEKAARDTDVVIPLPLEWHTLPGGAKLIED